MGGMLTSLVISFANDAFLAVGSKIIVTVPARFRILGSTLGSLTGIPATGTTAIVSSATTVQLTIASNTMSPGTGRSFTITNVYNPGSSCDQYIYEYCSPPWETYSIQIIDSAGNVYQENLAVAGTPILKKPLTFARVRPLARDPATVTPVTVTLSTQAPILIGGAIEVVFPAGFLVGTVAASGHVGIPTASTTVNVAGQTVTLTITGGNISPTNNMSVTFSGITTPANTATGYYIVRTRDTQGSIMEEYDKISGEGCTFLNNCNGHGTCTLFSKTCICDTGWGAPTDVANYKSPDCTLRKGVVPSSPSSLCVNASHQDFIGVCPAGLSWTSIPIDETTAHNTLAECSDMGICDRSTGRCSCFPGFEGSACDRSKLEFPVSYSRVDGEPLTRV
ncbi:hypothetical protein PINS_up004692 [Pythium insidiosum]|nr:hypothetical protein PINS_up004692 [Pythium insidiosum]